MSHSRSRLTEVGPGASRRRQIGNRGEDLAAQWYVAHGYEVVARNWRCRAGELDIVACKGTELVFCEVKARSSGSFGLPVEAVGRAKQARVRRLAGMWLTAAHSGALAGGSMAERSAPGEEEALIAGDKARCSRPATSPAVRVWRVRFDVASVLGRTVEVIEGAF